jgi:sulfur carrier protein
MPPAWVFLFGGEMLIEVNGKSKEIDREISVREFLLELGANPKVIVVELNRSILEQSQWNNTVLKENDKIEIISFVGGG